MQNNNNLLIFTTLKLLLEGAWKLVWSNLSPTTGTSPTTSVWVFCREVGERREKKKREMVSGFGGSCHSVSRSTSSRQWETEAPAKAGHTAEKWRCESSQQVGNWPGPGAIWGQRVCDVGSECRSGGWGEAGVPMQAEGCVRVPRSQRVGLWWTPSSSTTCCPAALRPRCWEPRFQMSCHSKSPE